MPKGEGKGQELERAEVVQRKREAAQLRIYKSWSYQAIADKFQVSVGTIRNWVIESTASMLPEEEVDELRKHEVAKIDEDERTSNTAIDMLKRQAVDYANEGKPIGQLIDSIRKWQEHRTVLRTQRARMLGLNKPVQFHHNVTVDSQFSEEIETLLTGLLGGGNLMSAPDEILDQNG